jgi:hypothetical protein
MRNATHGRAIHCRLQRVVLRGSHLTYVQENKYSDSSTMQELRKKGGRRGRHLTTVHENLLPAGCVVPGDGGRRRAGRWRPYASKKMAVVGVWGDQATRVIELSATEETRVAAGQDLLAGRRHTVECSGGEASRCAAVHLAWHPEGVRDGAARFFEDGELRLGRWLGFTRADVRCGATA